MKKLIFLFFSAAIFSGCGHEDVYPLIPALEFKNITQGSYNNLKTFTLTATFTDGDGDIGYFQDRPNDPEFDDTLSQYYYNFVLQLQVSKNGVWKDTVIMYVDENIDSILTDNDTTYYNDLISTRLPYLTQDGQNKGLKGDIDKTGFFPLPIADTIRFRAFIYDRAKHKSNEIYTPGFFIKNP